MNRLAHRSNIRRIKAVAPPLLACYSRGRVADQLDRRLSRKTDAD